MPRARARDRHGGPRARGARSRRSSLGAGVYYGAALTRSRAVSRPGGAVVGGANSAGQGALFFSRYARARHDASSASRSSRRRCRSISWTASEATANIKVITGVGGRGGARQTASRAGHVRDAADGERDRRSTAPRCSSSSASRRAPNASRAVVAMDEQGFILTGAEVPRQSAAAGRLDRDPLMFETSVPGVFAAGDVRASANRRIAAAVGEGSAAIYSVHRVLANGMNRGSGVPGSRTLPRSGAGSC